MKITNTMKTVMMLLAGMVASPLMAITFTRVSIEQPEGITHYRMYDEGKIYFSGNSMVVDTMGNGKVESIALSQVDKMLSRRWTSPQVAWNVCCLPLRR